MWKINEPQPVKLVFGIIAADEQSLSAAREQVEAEYGQVDFCSPVWRFDQTRYYADELGKSPLRQFITIEKPVEPELLAAVKIRTNEMERQLAGRFGGDLPRPVNIDPGYFETGKLVLASTKNFSHRVYIGQSIYAEVTLSYRHGQWVVYPFTFPDYKNGRYFEFFSEVRERLVKQLRDIRERQ